MMQQQADELMGREVISPPIHAPDAIRIPVSDKAEIVRVLLQPGGALRVILFHRLGVDAAEVWIVRGVKGRYFAARAGEQVGKTSGSDPEQSVMR